MVTQMSAHVPVSVPPVSVAFVTAGEEPPEGHHLIRKLQVKGYVSSSGNPTGAP
jgi:hypothetical protein